MIKKLFHIKIPKPTPVQLWAMISTILLFLSLLCLARAVKTINQFEHMEPQAYSESGRSIAVIMPSERTYLLSFRKNDVKINHCMGSTYQDAVALVAFIKGYANQGNLSIPRSTIKLIGEYRLHTMLSDMGYQREHTSVVDLDYVQDRRWYINTLSTLIGVLGL